MAFFDIFGYSAFEFQTKKPIKLMSFYRLETVDWQIDIRNLADIFVGKKLINDWNHTAFSSFWTKRIRLDEMLSLLQNTEKTGLRLLKVFPRHSV